MTARKRVRGCVPVERPESLADASAQSLDDVDPPRQPAGGARSHARGARAPLDVRYVMS
jgi:hypothetical protein